MSTESVVSFSRTMANYNVSTPFQLPFPKEFCDENLPSHDNAVVLVGEREREYSVMYLINQQKLGRGWKDFVIAHGLRVGDKLSFYLIDRCKFKVNVTRFTEREVQNNVPVSLGKRKAVAECFGNKVPKKYLHSCVKMQERMLSQIKKKVHEDVVSKEKVFIKSPPWSTGTDGAIGSSYVNFHDCPNDDEHTRIVEKEIPSVDVNDKTLLPPKDQSVTIENSESALSLNGFADFKIHVNGETLDSDIPQDVRILYYQLCCNQKKFIHEHVMTGLDSKFAVAVILEIVRIADSVKAASISTSHDDLECMWKTLKSFEDLCFAVGSLRAKISTLTKFSNEHETVEGESVSIEDSESALSLMNFEDFKINVNGETLDSEIPPEVRMKYCELCCGLKKFIHDRVLKCINSKFAVSVILEIVRIAESTTAATISTALHVLKPMGKTLKSFEELGFGVGTLRAKIGMLTILSSEHQEATRRMSKIESEGTTFQEKKAETDGLIGNAMAQNEELVGNSRSEIDAWKEKRERLDFIFKKAAVLLW